MSIVILAVSALLLALPGSSILAAESVAVPQARLSLLGGWRETDGTRVAGLEIVLAEGWKTYWRSPGRSGLPPRFDWSASGNVSSVEVEWPAPIVFESFGIETIGYGRDVTLPLRVVPLDPAEPITLDGVIEIGVCAEICIPVRARLTATWPATAVENAPKVRRFLSLVPGPASAVGIDRAACGVRGAGQRRDFEARLRFDAPPDLKPRILVEGPPTAWFGEVRTDWDGDTLVAHAEVRTFDPDAWVARDNLRLTLLWPDQAVSVNACAAP